MFSSCVIHQKFAQATVACAKPIPTMLFANFSPQSLRPHHDAINHCRYLLHSPQYYSRGQNESQANNDQTGVLQKHVSEGSRWFCRVEITTVGAIFYVPS